MFGDAAAPQLEGAWTRTQQQRTEASQMEELLDLVRSMKKEMMGMTTVISRMAFTFGEELNMGGEEIAHMLKV